MSESKITPTVTIDHEGVTYSGRIGTIKSTNLGFEDHGILTVMLNFTWDGGGVGVGGFCLDMPASREGHDYSRKGTAYGLDHIIRIIETVGVDSWEKLVGKQAIVLSEGAGGWGSLSVGFAGLLNGKVFIPKLHADAWISASEVAS